MLILLSALDLAQAAGVSNARGYQLAERLEPFAQTTSGRRLYSQEAVAALVEQVRARRQRNGRKPAAAAAK